MGLNQAVMVVGAAVRHRTAKWRGTVLEIGDGRVDYLIYVDPLGGRGPRWFNAGDFDPATIDADPADPTADLHRRYLTDPVFYHLVSRFRLGLSDDVFTALDVRDAMLVAEDLEQQRKARVAAGLEPDVQLARGRSRIQEAKDFLAEFDAVAAARRRAAETGDTAGDIVRGK